MTKDQVYQWALAARLDSGHRVFFDALTGEMAIADNSGLRPQETDDGVLWLDKSRALTIGDGFIHLPVKSNGGSEFYTPIVISDVPTLVELGFSVVFGKDKK